MSSTVLDEELAATAVAGSGNTTLSVGLAPTNLVRGTLVDRYVVLSKLGAGGMGVVLAAYDPELDRKVALKLLLPRLAADADLSTIREARARLVREAQALAKLSHPHIVAVHDVGEHQGMVWLAMEYVDGDTLSAWLKERRRTWHEVLAVLTPAALGLAAAHEAGLVHRDIKPDNIMVGRDGRVRVMDLGLVRALGGDATPARPVAPNAATAAAGVLVTQVGSVLGTPAYMSPEQFRGESADARTDVFSFCATLWEALMGERPFAGETLLELATNVLSSSVRRVRRDPTARRVPGWLRRVCLRGLAARPERRFPTMKHLLDALSHGRARARARTWFLGATAAAVVGASAALVEHHDRAERIAACEDVGASIFDVWSEEARAGVRAGILATGVSYASVTADKVMPFLDAEAAAWKEHRTQACRMADIDETLDAEQFDRAVWCLDERRMDLGALVAELSRADATAVQNAVSAAAGLPPVASCTDRQVLAALPPPPPAAARANGDAVRATLSRVRALLAAGNYPDALKLSRMALAEAQALGWPPMIAAARQLEGALLNSTGAYAEAEAASVSAYMEAAKVRAWDVAAAAAVSLVQTVGYRQARYTEGKVWAGHAEVAVLFVGDPLGLGEADRLTNLAILHWATGAYAEAKGLHERALAIREKALGPEHLRVANSLTGLAGAHWATGAYADATALLQRALAITETSLGAEHPEVGIALNNLAAIHQTAGEYAETKALLERALVILEKALDPEHPQVASTLSNLAVVHKNAGGYAEAEAMLERALAIDEKALGPEHPDVAITLANLAEVHQIVGEYAEARAMLGRALSITEKALGPEHPAVAANLAALGSLALAQDQPTEALSYLERAVAINDANEGTQENEVVTRFNLAEALVRTGDRVRALAEARRAADGFRAAGEGKAKELALVEAFLAKHKNTP